MKYRLNAQHYADDRLLEPGAIVGDGDEAVHPWRYPADIQTDVQNIKAGQAMPPSKEMTPLDDEAKKLYGEAFPQSKPKHIEGAKPTAIQGTGNVGVQKPTPPRPSSTPAAYPSTSAASAQPKKG